MAGTRRTIEKNRKPDGLFDGLPGFRGILEETLTPGSVITGEPQAYANDANNFQCFFGLGVDN